MLSKKRSDHPPLLSEPNVEEVLLDYDLLALFSEPFTEAAFYLRNTGRIDQPIMGQQTTTLLGCGALGGELADCLGKAGVGNIWLTDNQEMRAHNTVRHLAGIDHLGMPKVLAVKQILFEHNRFVSVTCRMANVLRQPLKDYFAPTGIGISSMADDNTEGYVNEQAVNQGRTMYYVRALRGGKAARIFRVQAGRDACFHCLALYKQEGADDFPVVPEDVDLPTIRNECNNPVRPASAADLKLIAALASRLILDQLQDEADSSTNHWVWTTEPLLGLGATAELPQALLAKQLPPHPSCSICQPRLDAVFIQPSALRLMQQLTHQTPGIETGGILVGRLREGRKVVIEAASEPGPQARCSATGFDRDVAYCQRFVDEQAASGRLYLGEWHSHPTENNQPSQTDLDSLSKVAQQPDYLTTQPIMIIMSRSGVPACTVHPVGKPHYAVPLVEQEA
jgi:integrative and conjugative element protein (TIGR02256 family)